MRMLGQMEPARGPKAPEPGVCMCVRASVCVEEGLCGDARTPGSRLSLPGSAGRETLGC